MAEMTGKEIICIGVAILLLGISVSAISYFESLGIARKLEAETALIEAKAKYELEGREALHAEQ